MSSEMNEWKCRLISLVMTSNTFLFLYRTPLADYWVSESISTGRDKNTTEAEVSTPKWLIHPITMMKSETGQRYNQMLDTIKDYKKNQHFYYISLSMKMW